MRNVVAELSKHKFFELCEFKDKRFAYEDAVSKLLHLLLTGSITDIKPQSITRTYEQNTALTSSNAAVKSLKRAFNFVHKALKGKTPPSLRKFSVLTLTYLTVELLAQYDLGEYPDKYAEAYLQFEHDRTKNDELPEEQQDPRLLAYTNAARSDSIQDMVYRHEQLGRAILIGIPELISKDERREFSSEQRSAIYWRDAGKCRDCGKECLEAEFHADHIVPYSKGGKTKIENGQVLCIECNLKKGPKTV